MTQPLADKSPQRHPWLEVLVASPHEAVSDLLAGYAALFPYTRDDAPDAARKLLGHLATDDPARDAMATGILLWLEARRRDPLPSDPARLQDFVRQVSEALEIISLIELTGPARQLRHQYVRWSEWANRLVMSPSRDPRAAYLRMLANTQRIVGELVADRDALAPFWMRVCREAGSQYPKGYLQIGLLGLRRLPGAIEHGDSPWIAGLAAWAKEQKPSDNEFTRAWRPIKRLHPASPKVLRRRVFDVLSQKSFTGVGIVSPGWWASDPDFPKTQAPKARGRSLEPPSRELLEGIIRDLRDGASFADVRERLDSLVERYQRYTDVTGDDYFLIRSFCNVGNVLLRHVTEAHAERAQFAERLARETLRYQPRDPIAWGLWRDALFSGGKYAASVALGWETVRRFPNNPHMRTELAEILIALGEVEATFKLVIDSIEARVFDFMIYSILSRLHSNFGDDTEAREATETGLSMEPDNHDLLLNLKDLNAGQPLPLVSKARKHVLQEIEMDEQDSTFSDLQRNGRLRELRERLQIDNDAKTDLMEILNDDPTFAYAQILAARHKLWHASEHGLPPVAAAFEEALANEDIERLTALTEKMPRLESLILLARAILGDEVAANEVADRLRNPSAGDDERAVEILSKRFQPVFELIDGGLQPTEAVNRCADQLRIAIYDANEALSAPELMVA